MARMPGMTTGSVPVPDPTRLTTDAVNAATDQWRRDLAGMREIIEVRLTASDAATVLHADTARQLAERAERGLAYLEALHDQRFDTVTERIGAVVRVEQEKFAGIEQQFDERDVRTQQQTVAGAQALAAALQAAKELVGAQGEASAAAAVKSETSFTKQIDQIAVIISTLEKALDARITELKERIDRTEGQRTGSAATIGYIIAAITVFIAIVSVIFTVVVK